MVPAATMTMVEVLKEDMVARRAGLFEPGREWTTGQWAYAEARCGIIGLQPL